MLVWMKQGFLNPETVEQCHDFVCLKLASFKESFEILSHQYFLG